MEVHSVELDAAHEYTLLMGSDGVTEGGGNTEQSLLRMTAIPSVCKQIYDLATMVGNSYDDVTVFAARIEPFSGDTGN